MSALRDLILQSNSIKGNKHSIVEVDYNYKTKKQKELNDAVDKICNKIKRKYDIKD